MTVDVSGQVPVFAKFVAGIAFGLGVVTLVSFDPVAVPVVGSLPALAVGDGAIALASGIIVGLDRASPDDDCGCAGDCGCS